MGEMGFRPVFLSLCVFDLDVCAVWFLSASVSLSHCLMVERHITKTDDWPGKKHPLALVKVS